MGDFTYYTIYSPAICAKYRKNRLEMRLQMCYSIVRTENYYVQKNWLCLSLQKRKGEKEKSR